MTRLRTVVFDLDGTLVDTIGLIVASYQHAFRTVVGQEQDEALIRSWIGQPLIRAFRDGHPDHADALYETYQAWNLANTESLIRRYEGIDVLLRDLRAHGIGTAVATSKRREPAHLALRLTRLDGLVDTVVGMEDTEAHKPDPAPLLLAAARAGTGGPTAYVGDATVDMLAARAAGMTAIAVTWGAQARETLAQVGPDHLVSSVAQLRAILLAPHSSHASPTRRGE